MQPAPLPRTRYAPADATVPPLDPSSVPTLRTIEEAPSRDDETLPSAASRFVGVVLDGRYRIERLVGQGGMGAVYEATELATGRAFAVKVLPIARASLEALRRFYREASTLAALRHPNVVSAVEVGTMPDGTAFLVMEMLRGSSLGAIVSAGRVPWRRAAELARQIAEAMAAAHRNGVVHRDLKPDNLFVVPGPGGTEVVKVLDFGIAHAIGDKRLTRLGTVMGTPRYMAPEQCLGRVVDGRADVYALGCVLYELLTGHPPFWGGTPVSILRRQIGEPPLPLSEAEPAVGLPAGLEALVMRCLEKEPAERPATAEELARELSRWAEAPPTSVGPRVVVALGVLGAIAAMASVAAYVGGLG